MESIKEAKANCYQANLDAQALCFAIVKEARAVCSHATLEAKAICLEMVKEAKTTCTCSIQENEAVCSMAIGDAEANKASQAELLQKEHDNMMQDLERQVIQEEARSQTDVLSACQATMCASPLVLKNVMATSYHIPIRTYISITPYCPIAKDLPSGGSAGSSCPSCIGAQTVPSAQKMTPFPRSCGEHTFGQNHFKGDPRRTPLLQVARSPALEQST